MMTTHETHARRSAPMLPVDEDEDFEAVELPSAFRLASEADAAMAGRYLDEVHDTLHRQMCAVELAERALRSAEIGNARAEQARTEIRLALAAFEELNSALDTAQCVITFAWGTPPHIAGNPSHLHAPRAAAVTRGQA